MEIEEIKRIKEETEAQILELLDQFTVKTGLYLKEIALLEGPRIGQLYSEVVHVEIKTALPEEVSSRRGITMEGIEKKLKEKGMSSEEIESIKKGIRGGEREKEVKVTDMTGDMTDIEFELIVDEVHERMEDWIYQIGKQRIRKMLDFYRADLSTLQSMDVNFRFECNSDFFNQILGRIRRKK